ncbi:endolytic transglycosylase MltG [Ilumatobacter sp.]|uniref:endolytic transglycosylase MltG n=1 Tax=Ilumatobacter sp. TaxID=1967498 RepID=UPI003B5220E1
MPRTLDPLLPEAEVDPDARPAIDWPTDPWDDADRTGSVERLRRQTRPIKWAVYAAIALFTVLTMIAGAVGWWYLQRINPPGEPGAIESFTVAEAETLETLAQRLEDDGFITDAGVFEWYVERNDGLEITPGYYKLRPDDHMGNVLAALRTPPGQTYTNVTFPEGFTIDQMGRRLETTVDRMSAADFSEAAADPSLVSLWEPPGGATTLEGLLFPDTYQVSNAESEGQIIDRMIGIMERVGNQEDIIPKSAALGRTPYETLIIASLIEREAGDFPEDRAKISRVIHNRLAVTAANPDDPFPLQIDAAVLYGRNQLGIDPDTPFDELRRTDSDWNTYSRPGLPTTPIANPGRASIEAALNPAPNPPPGDPVCAVLPEDQRAEDCFYFFYVKSDNDGRHEFAATFEAHLRNIDEARAAGVDGV